MQFLSPGRMIAIGFGMVILGLVLSLMMVIRSIEPSFFLIFFTYVVSSGGLLLGLIGAAYIFISDRNRRN